MPKIAIITDTDSSLPASVATKLGIQLVPIKIQFSSESFDTGIDIDDRQLFVRVDTEGKLPKTAAPAPGLFVKAYQKAFDSGAEQIICITISSEMSAVCTAATTASQEFPGREIHVVDSKTLCMAQGFMAITAAEMAANGASCQEILSAISDVRDRCRVFGALATVKYLAMSGRVGQVAAGLASILNIRPILTVKDGKLVLLERIRTQRLAWERVVSLVEQAAAGRRVERVAFFHVAVADDAARFAEQFCKRVACPPDTLTVEVTPGLSVHTGSGMVGVVVILTR
ncbi:MAG: DegV family protein [Anaerolineae bacterium]